MSNQDGMREVMQMMDAVQRAQVNHQETVQRSDVELLARMRTLYENQGLHVEEGVLASAFEELYGRRAQTLVPTPSITPPAPAPQARKAPSPLLKKRRWWLNIELWLGISLLLVVAQMQLLGVRRDQENQKSQQGARLLNDALTEIRLLHASTPEIKIEALQKKPRNDLNLWGGDGSVQRLATGGFRIEYTNLPATACMRLVGEAKHQIKDARVTHGGVTTQVMSAPGVIDAGALIKACSVSDVSTISMDTRSLGGLGD